MVPLVGCQGDAVQGLLALVVLGHHVKATHHHGEDVILPVAQNGTAARVEGVDLDLEADGEVRLGELGDGRADQVGALEAESVARGSGVCGWTVAEQGGS